MGLSSKARQDEVQATPPCSWQAFSSAINREQYFKKPKRLVVSREIISSSWRPLYAVVLCLRKRTETPQSLLQSVKVTEVRYDERKKNHRETPGKLFVSLNLYYKHTVTVLFPICIRSFNCSRPVNLTRDLFTDPHSLEFSKRCVICSTFLAELISWGLLFQVPFLHLNSWVLFFAIWMRQALVTFNYSV